MMKSMQPMMSRHNNSEHQPTLDRTPVNARPSITQRSTERYTNHTTGFARRAFLLLMFLVAYVGSVGGQTVKIKESATAKITETVYAKNGQSSYGLSTEIVSKIVTNIPGLAADNIYVRWNAYKDNERVKFTGQWGNPPFYINPTNGNSYQFSADPDGYYIYGQINVYAGSTIEEVLGAKVTIDNSTLDDYVIEYYISKNREQIRSNVEEPDEFDMKVELIFNEKGKKEDAFLNDNNSTATYDRLPKTITLTDEYDAATNTVMLLQPEDWPESDVRFVRWYIAKADGNPLDAEEESSTWINQPAGFMKDDEGAHGWYWHDASLLSTKSLQIPTVTLPESEDFEDYRLVAVMSTTEGAVDGNTLTKEPIYTLMYYFSFEFPFRGDASNATKAETTLKVRPSRQSNSMTLSFDYNTNTIKLISGSEELDNTTIDDSFMVSYSTMPENFYIRWFLRKGDIETYIENSMDGGDIYYTPSQDKYYYYWSTKKDGNARNLSDILKITINGLQLSELANYDLVCTIATNPAGETYDNSGKLTHEPNTLAFEYVFHFADKFIEAENLSMVKTIHKAALYDKSTGKITPALFVDANSYKEVQADMETSQNNGYIRWYITDTEGNLVSDMGQWEFNSTMKVGQWDTGYQKNDTYGYYMEGEFFTWDAANKYNPTFTMPEGYNKNEDYKKYLIVCIVTTDKTGIDLPDKEPTNMMVKYVFNEILVEGDFVHYKGQSGRDWITPNVSTRTQAQLFWDNTTEETSETAVDIRQGVHTWEYDVYVTPEDERILMLPIMKYTTDSKDLEPRAYFRWYDWNTDNEVKNQNFIFAPADSDENQLKRIGDRGLFGICIDKDPTHNRIGVTFTPTNDFKETIDIACDVSKYWDGIVEIGGNYYLRHEPTLSTRYIFHIHPAKEIADRLMDAKQKLQDAEDEVKENINNKQKLYDEMSALEEDKGKVVVSLNGTSGSFALRFDHHNLFNYTLHNGSDYVSADETQWYAYFEDEKGIWKKEIKGDNDTETGRITTFNFSAFTGDYSDLQGNKRSETVDYGEKKFHVVGYVVNNKNNINAPVVHYELHFISAPPKKLTEIPKERTEAYMRYYYDLAAVVDFDGNPKTNPNIAGHEAEYYSTEHWFDMPMSKDENMTHVPFQWDDIQYGFCYPELRNYVKNTWSVGLSPIHGDYIVLKSMNMTGISESVGDATPNDYHWYNGNTLYDYTYYATKDQATPQYGSFIYTDASDESRSMATIPFTANLCKGSSIYFTAAVADMTDGSAKPQLLIRIVGIDKKNNRKRIVAFHTCDIFTLGAGAGEWYQVYGVSTVPTDFDTTIDHFEAEVINYANSTMGADFAIDQIMIYTSTAKVLLTQTSSNDCDKEEAAEENKVQVYMAAEGLQNAFGISDNPQPIYWRICEEGTVDPITGTNMYPRYNADGTLNDSDYDGLDSQGKHTYGVTYVTTNYSENDVKEIIPDIFGWYKTKDGEFFFQLANKSFSALEEGKNYYVSVYTPDPDGVFNENNAANWGNPTDICSIYSEFFIPRRQYVTYIVPETDGEEGGDLTIACGSTGATVTGIKMVLKVPDDDALTGFVDKEIHFDYAFFDKTKWNANEPLKEGTDYTYADLVTALSDYRTKYMKAIGLDEGYNATENTKNYSVLKYAVDNGILELANSPTFTHTFDKVSTHHILCIPIEQSIDDKEICGPFEVIFKLKESGGPSLTLGFDDVNTYPNSYRVVRVGLNQLKNMKNGYLLHIPVHSFKTEDKATINNGKLKIISNFLQLLTYSNDPTAISQTNDNTAINGNASAINVATFDGTEISASRKYISINFNGNDVTEQDFHEGFTYHMFFQVKKDGATANDCEGNVNFLIKVVPEYVTWNDKGTEVTLNSNDNTNWNNDKNWSRSKKKELYSSSYKDNSDMNITSTPAAFVPMKFTYVTIPSKNVAPNLMNLEIGNEGIYTDMGNGATGNIQYDLMVRVEKECLDAKHSENGRSNIYDCEKFYGNWAKEIYFKPEAELMYQQYLTYEKVWVEKELTAGTWYLMSTPLQNTYAGDMYVPTTGRQETEAFKEIKFTDQVEKDDEMVNLYSRTAYPIYQKSWLQEGSKVYTMTNDIRKTDYSANLAGSVSEKLSLWSHTYNDVQVNYSQWKGFAIRAHKTDYNGTRKNALLRLPKEDTDYDYYKWDDKKPTDGQLAQTVDKKATDGTHLATGKLFTDGTPNTYGLTYGVDYQPTANDSKQPRTAGTGTVDVKIGEVQDAKNYPNNIADYYLLVGNPYLCSINMEEFLNVNKDILGTSGYWTYEDNNTISSLLINGKIKPLQAFFVKLKANTTNGNTEIKFTPAMMMDGNNSSDPSRTFTLTAANDHGQSTASVSVGEEAKSIETLFDSNLADVPMVYTVANGQAVSVNQMTEFDRPIAFGVTCDSNEPISVIFSDVAQLTSSEVWLVDAVTGEQTTVTEGCAISVQPNDYGRYFLLAGALNIGDKADVQQGIMVSVRGRMVTVTSGEELTLVRIMSPDGTTVQQYTGGGTTASFVLSPGVYVINAENIACEQQTVKVIVK